MDGKTAVIYVRDQRGALRRDASCDDMVYCVTPSKLESCLAVSAIAKRSCLGLALVVCGTVSLERGGGGGVTLLGNICICMVDFLDGLSATSYLA